MRSRTLAIRALALLSFLACSEPPIADWTPISVALTRATPAVSIVSSDDVLDVTWATDSTLFVSMLLGQQLDLVRWNGTRQRAVARKGNGPGEVQGAAWLLRRDDSTLVSVDIMQPRIAWWSLSGDLRHEVTPELPFITGAWSTGLGLALRIARPTHTTFTWFDDSGRVLFNRAFTAARNSSTSSCGSCATAVGADGLIAMAIADTGYRFLRINVNGDTLRPVDHPGHPLPGFSPSQQDSLEVRAQQIRALMDRINADARTRAQFRARMYPKTRARFMPRSVFLDDDARLWVQRQVTGGDSAEVDLFDADADYIGTIRLPPGSTLRRVDAPRLLVSITDPQGRTTIAEFRLVE